MQILILEDREGPVDHPNQEDQNIQVNQAGRRVQGLPSCQVGR